MGKAPLNAKIAKLRSGLSIVWAAIGEHVQAAPNLSLRDAVNIIGFRSFSIGWTWTEYKAKKTPIAPPYEVRAQIASRVGVPILDPSPEGLIAKKSAVSFRASSARRTLYDITSRNSVPMRIYNADAYGRIADERDRLDETLQFDIARGSISLHGYRERAEIDGPRLVKYLSRKKAPWQSKVIVHDWLAAERLARDVFECMGSHLSNQDVIRRCRERYKIIYPNSRDLDGSAYAELVADLRREYVSDE
jgi:hypothetical protein